MTYKPIIGEIRAMFVEGEIRAMIWNGEKWLFYSEVYPIIHWIRTGTQVNWGDANGLR